MTYAATIVLVSLSFLFQQLLQLLDLQLEIFPFILPLYKHIYMSIPSSSPMHNTYHFLLCVHLFLEIGDILFLLFHSLLKLSHVTIGCFVNQRILR